MRLNGSRKVILIVSSALLLTTLSAAKTKSTNHKSTRAVTSKKTTKHASSRHSRHSRRSRKMAWKYRGQRKPDAQRTREIQIALARENYLHSQPSGVWDQNTRDAMARFQEDHGWQSKMVPDARALIELGLGPRNDNLLNPESAMTSTPIASTGAADRDMPSAPFQQ